MVFLKQQTVGLQQEEVKRLRNQVKCCCCRFLFTKRLFFQENWNQEIRGESRPSLLRSVKSPLTRKVRGEGRVGAAPTPAMTVFQSPHELKPSPSHRLSAQSKVAREKTQWSLHYQYGFPPSANQRLTQTRILIANPASPQLPPVAKFLKCSKRLLRAKQ